MLGVHRVLLALAVAMSNMVCACVANSDQKVPACHERVASCHADGAAEVGEGCPPATPARTPCEGKGSPHDCAHCTGTINADAPKAARNLDSPVVSPTDTLIAPWVPLLHSQATGHLYIHCGLSPPAISQPTLLSLGCSMNN